MKHSVLASPKATIEVLARWGLSTKKSLGQHFLIDDSVVGRILALADVKTGSRIIEVGPGIGTLTVALLSRGAEVIAIERDTDLLPVLAETTAIDSERLTLLECDALKVTHDDLVWRSDIARRSETTQRSDIARRSDVARRGETTQRSDIARRSETVTSAPSTTSALPASSVAPTSSAASTSSTPIALVANLPYAVAATVILDFFERFDIASATVMVQREVAERIAAAPGSKEYGAYTAKLKLRAQPVDSFAVPRTCFLPQPRVDSTVIRLERYRPSFSGTPLDDDLLTATSFVIDAAFTQRRKTIRNSMRAFFAARGKDPALVDDLLEQAHISPTVRGETLDLEGFISLGATFLSLLSDRALR